MACPPPVSRDIHQHADHAVQQGDRFQLNVIDQLTNHTMLKTTSIVRCHRLLNKYLADYFVQHWHGFFQKGTNWADGPAFINQCPIASGHSFLYDFQVPDQAGKLHPLRRAVCLDAHVSCAGTFWYHSHLSTQYCDGLRGPFVVYDPKDPLKGLYDVDNGQFWLTSLLTLWVHLTFIHTDSTVITLSDWYHVAARLGPSFP